MVIAFLPVDFVYPSGTAVSARSSLFSFVTRLFENVYASYFAEEILGIPYKIVKKKSKLRLKGEVQRFQITLHVYLIFLKVDVYACSLSLNRSKKKIVQKLER